MPSHGFREGSINAIRSATIHSRSLDDCITGSCEVDVNGPLTRRGESVKVICSF